MCLRCCVAYSRRLHHSMAYCLRHADFLHHHVDQNSNRVRYSTDDLVRTFEITLPLERYLKLLNLKRQRIDMRLIRQNLIERLAIGMMIGSSKDLRSPKNAVWPLNAALRCLSSLRCLVRLWCDGGTWCKDLLESCKDMEHPHLKSLSKIEFY